MPSAPAKLILCGEHAVVYQRPAIAVPLAAVRAYADVSPGRPGSGLHFHAPDLGADWTAEQRPDDPLSELACATLAALAGVEDLHIALRSDIPIASGMGSGAAIGTALVRALAAYAGKTLDAATIAALVYDSERRYHGTPSGIDNNVVAYERAIWFQRQPDGPPHIASLMIAQPLQLLIGDSGVRSATKLPVGALRERWQAETAHYEALFDEIGATVYAARSALANGDLDTLAAQLNRNQVLLRQIGVSSHELERLIDAALRAGAAAAKLSGAGWGGVMFALVSSTTADSVREALLAAGAVRVLTTTVAAHTADRV
jgi:mevalonate kinase